MNKLFYTILTIVISALIAAPALSGSTPKGKPFVYLNEQIEEVNGAVSSIQDQVDALVKQVDTIEERVSANETAIDYLISQNEMLAVLLASYEEDLDAMNVEIDALQAEIDNNNRLIQALNDEIDEINRVLDLKQNLVTGTCPAGSSIREILADGSVICESDGLSGTGLSTTGISSVRSYNYTSISGRSSDSVQSSCPVGYTLSGGGFYGYKIKVDSSYPDNNFGWYVSGSNPSSYNNYLTSWAMCIK